ncbi:MAG: Gfo/Idh/MocA family protein [Candidatus Margulisiibacteriota bacterium]
MKRGKGIKIGVIGLGVMGNHYTRIISSLPRAKLAAVADIDPQKTKEKAEEFKAKGFNNHLGLINEVEAICLTTPTSTHFQIAKDCLLANKHLLVEKPFTGNSAQARELIAIAHEKNLILAVNFTERYNPAFQILRRQLKDEKIIGINFKRLSPYPERITDTNVIFDLMIHDLDLLNLLVPDEIEKIKTAGEKVKSKSLDRVTTTIYYKSGIIASIEASRIFSIKTRKILVSTERCLLEADLLNKRIYRRDFSTAIPSVLPVNPTDQLTEVLKNFIAALSNKKSTLPTGKEALQALQLAERIESLC